MDRENVTFFNFCCADLLLSILEVHFLQETNSFVYGLFNDTVTEGASLGVTL
jgi:hypothetical protein